MLYWDGSQWLKIAVGQNGQALILQNGIPTWSGVQLPILNTSGISNRTSNSATCGGNIASDGGSPIIARGVCWSTLPLPTLADNYTFNGEGSGIFQSEMTGLILGYTYFFR